MHFTLSDLHGGPGVVGVLLVKEGDKVLTVDLLQLTLLSVVHHGEVLVVVCQVVQRERSVESLKFTS